MPAQGGGRGARKQRLLSACLRGTSTAARRLAHTWAGSSVRPAPPPLAPCRGECFSPFRGEGSLQLTPLAAARPASPAHRSFLVRVPAGAKSRRVQLAAFFGGDCHRPPREVPRLVSAALHRPPPQKLGIALASLWPSAHDAKSTHIPAPAPRAHRDRESHEQRRVGVASICPPDSRIRSKNSVRRRIKKASTKCDV